jgi:hypothetical protein
MGHGVTPPDRCIEGFDFEEMWQVIIDDYPALFWEEVDFGYR